MNKIFKYTLETTDQQILKLPKGAKILSLQTQNNIPCIWAMIDTHAIETEEQHIINTYGTGHQLPLDMSNQVFLGTYQLMNGALTFHVFKQN